MTLHKVRTRDELAALPVFTTIRLAHLPIMKGKEGHWHQLHAPTVSSSTLAGALNEGQAYTVLHIPDEKGKDE